MCTKFRFVVFVAWAVVPTLVRPAAIAAQDSFTWTGNAANQQWNDPLNWTSPTAAGQAPGNDDSALFTIDAAVGNGGGQIQNLTIDSGVVLTVAQGRLDVSAQTSGLSVIDNAGTLLIDSSTYFTGVDLSIREGNTTLQGGGTLRLAGRGSVTSSTSEMSLEDAFLDNTDNTIAGWGVINFFADGTLRNTGVIDADTAGENLVFEIANSPQRTTPHLLNRSILRASNGGTLRSTETRIDNTGGIIEALDGSVIDFGFGDTSVFGGTFRTSGTGTVLLGGGQFRDFRNEGRIQTNQSTRFSGIVDNDGQVVVAQSGAFTNSDAWVTNNTAWEIEGTGEIVFVNNGLFSLGRDAVFTNDGSITFNGNPNDDVFHTLRGNGRVEFSERAEIVNNGVISADDPTGVLNFFRSESPQNNEPSVIRNHGRIQARDGGSLVIGPGISVIGAGAFEIDATSTARFDGDLLEVPSLEIGDGSGFTFNGQGLATSVITGGFDQRSGTLAPAGDETGALTIGGDYHMNLGAELLIDVDSLSRRDTVLVDGDAEINGALTLTISGLTGLSSYEQYDLLAADSITGVFNEVDITVLPPGFGAVVTYDETSVGFQLAVLGDADLSGQVEQADLDAVLLNWGKTAATHGVSWATGDLNGNGQVEQGDLDAVLLNWGSAAAPDFSLNPGVVPEPGGVVLGLIGLGGVRVRRRA